MLEVAIRHRYDDTHLDIVFSSEAQSIALFGDSGAGKTSVLDAIAGLLKPDAGRIALDGQTWFDSARSISVPVRERAVGYVFQDGRLFPHMSVHANLLYGPRSRGGSHNLDIDDLDEIVDLLALAPLLPRRPATLSGGERQRVAIGRALLATPRILLLDEPLTGLHHEARLDVFQHLRRLRERQWVTMLLVSHQALEVQALADEVIVLGDGSVLSRCDVETFTRERPTLDSIAPNAAA
ncbi:MAG: ATP-binding cassette domain-containing protein [Dokdonella sp.]